MEAVVVVNGEILEVLAALLVLDGEYPDLVKEEYPEFVVEYPKLLLEYPPGLFEYPELVGE